jgi:hypothetical protein
VTHRPGNLVLVARAATADRAILGRDAGWHATVRTVGVAPWWLRAARPPFLRLVDVVGRPAAGTIASAVAIVLATAAVAVVAASRRRLDVLSAAALSLWLCGAVALVARSVPLGKNTIGLMQYVLTWASPAGMWVWVMLAWSAAVLIAPAWHRVRLRAPIPAVAGIALVAAASAWTLGHLGPERKGAYFRPIGTAAERVSHAVPGRQAVYVDAPASFTTLDFLPAITYALRREGTRVMVPRAVAVRWGSRYRPARGAYDWVVGIRGADAPSAGARRVIARVPGRVTVTLAPAAPPRPGRARLRRSAGVSPAGSAAAGSCPRGCRR